MHHALQIVSIGLIYFSTSFTFVTVFMPYPAYDDADCGEWIRDEFPDLAYWLTYYKFDRRQANRRLKQYAVGDKQWRETL